MSDIQDIEFHGDTTLNGIFNAVKFSANKVQVETTLSFKNQTLPLTNNLRCNLLKIGSSSRLSWLYSTVALPENCSSYNLDGSWKFEITVPKPSDVSTAELQPIGVTLTSPQKSEVLTIVNCDPIAGKIYFILKCVTNPRNRPLNLSYIYTIAG